MPPMAATLADTAESPTRTVQGVCPHDCPDTCALRVTVAGAPGAERVLRVAGDPDHPPTHGVLCTKVSRYAERTYSAQRLLTPLKRVGRKGEGRFEPIGWDEALVTIAARLSAIAARQPEAILPYSYAGTMGLVQGDGMRRASSTAWAPACWTAPSAPMPAARRWPPPTAASWACAWSSSSTAGSS